MHVIGTGRRKLRARLRNGSRYLDDVVVNRSYEIAGSSAFGFAHPCFHLNPSFVLAAKLFNFLEQVAKYGTRILIARRNTFVQTVNFVKIVNTFGEKKKKKIRIQRETLMKKTGEEVHGDRKSSAIQRGTRRGEAEKTIISS